MPDEKSLLTIHNLVFTCSTIGFVAPKAVAAYQGQSVSLNTLDWVTGGSIPVLFHALNQCREKKILPLSWYFDEHLPTLVCERLRMLKRNFGRHSGSVDPRNHVILPIRNAQAQHQSTSADLEGDNLPLRPELDTANGESDAASTVPSSDSPTAEEPDAVDVNQSGDVKVEDIRDADVTDSSYQNLDAAREAASVDITAIPTWRRLTGLGPLEPSTTFHILTPEDPARGGGRLPRRRRHLILLIP
ncbi:hypothetical protein BD410DRAFT_846071 [Rickenella mellea]|uniref:Uncharacterized protein n=1 Tax=Rickenella mellea TaxID=50990 RepID=A0A4Y7PH97_9AGAM|nr:hypothetical protein BD410DRAFT_846071 [Rickenella mellea]